MPRPPRENRATIIDATLTSRLTRKARDILACLVDHPTKLASKQGFVMEPTVAAYRRGLIRREANRQGITTRLNEEGKPVWVQRSA
jgi:hypothetical protein